MAKAQSKGKKSKESGYRFAIELDGLDLFETLAR